MPTSKKPTLGQGLNEYALAVGLVCLVSLGALTLMGTQVNGLLGGMLTVNNATPAVPSVSPVVPGSVGAGLGGPAVSGATTLPNALPMVSASASVPEAQVCFKGGRLCVALPTFPNGVANVQQDVSGGYGELLKAYADSMTQLVGQLQADPEMQGQDLQPLIDLAQSGHLLADNLTNIQKACQSQKNLNNTGGTCKMTTSGGAWDFHAAQNTDPVKLRQQFVRQQATVQRFLDQASGLPSGVKSLVGGLGDQIFTLHDDSIGKLMDSKVGSKDTNRCERRARKGKKLVNSCVDVTFTSTLSVDVTANADVITVDANTICATGTQQQAQCTVAPLSSPTPGS